MPAAAARLQAPDLQTGLCWARRERNPLSPHPPLFFSLPSSHLPTKSHVCRVCAAHSLLLSFFSSLSSTFSFLPCLFFSFLLSSPPLYCPLIEFVLQKPYIISFSFIPFSFHSLHYPFLRPFLTFAFSFAFIVSHPPFSSAYITSFLSSFYINLIFLSSTVLPPSKTDISTQVV